MSRGKAYRRWKTLSKYVSRLKDRLFWMHVQYGEIEINHDGVKYKRKLWRNPESWKEVDEGNVFSTKSLKDTPTPYTEPWKKVEDKKTIKKMREESRKIIDDELNNDCKT